MILFMLLAAAMLLAALAFVILPLVRTPLAPVSGQESLTVLADGVRELDAELASGRSTRAEYEQACRDLELQALEADAAASARRGGDARAGWSAALAAGIALPLAATILYVALGQPSALLAAGTGAHAGVGQAQMDGAIEALSRRLEDNESDGEGWTLLARSYLAANRVADAIGAYRKATAIMTDHPDLLVEYANTLAIANNRNLGGKPEELVARALEIDPDNFNALALGGAAALQGGNRELALKHWTRLEALLEPGSEDQARIASLVALAKGEPAPTSMPSTRTASTAPAPHANPHPAEGGAAKAQPGAGAGAEIRGTVTIAGELAGKVAPTDTLFIFARAVGGPPMPLAAVRARAGAWPVSFTLDDSSAMVEGMALSGFPRVDIVARVSRLGSATSQPGDIEGRIENVALGSDGVHVVMDRVVGR